MLICYLDEAGDTSTLPSAASSIQPVFVPAAIIFPQARMHAVTTAFLQVKHRYFPSLRSKTGHYLDSVRQEIKGADLRRNLREGQRRAVRQTLGFLDRVLELAEQNRARIIGRALIKGIARPIDPRALYAYSVQDICHGFQRLLEREDEVGLFIADARNKPQNSQVAHSIFTQKFSLAGDPYERMLEMPTYGHSENHVGLQLADLLCSAFLFPLGTPSSWSDTATG